MVILVDNNVHSTLYIVYIEMHISPPFFFSRTHTRANTLHTTRTNARTYARTHARTYANTDTHNTTHTRTTTTTTMTCQEQHAKCLAQYLNSLYLLRLKIHRFSDEGKDIGQLGERFGVHPSRAVVARSKLRRAPRHSHSVQDAELNRRPSVEQGTRENSG